MFCLMFPYSLIAETGKTYKAPRNSLSYFVEDQAKSGVAVIAPPEEPAAQAAEPVVEPEEVEETVSVPAVIETNNIEEKQTEKSLDAPVKAKPAATPAKKIVLAKAVSKPQPKAIAAQPAATTPVVSIKRASSTYADSRTVFSEILERMQKRSDERKAEAEKLGIVLPSQGGDISAVSPALAKINAKVKNLVDKHNCSGQGSCNFCR